MERKNLPKSATGNSSIVGYIIGAFVTISGGFFIWEIIENSGFSFSANWSMFDSILFIPLYIVGLIVMFANWSKINYVVIYRLDISNVLFYNIIFPILIRFIVIPLVVAAMIYYPLQCIIAIVGSIFPYIIAVIVGGIIVAIWIWNNNTSKNMVIFVVANLCLTLGFAVGSYLLHPKSVSTTKRTSTSITEEEFVDSKFDGSDIPDSEFE